MRIQSRLFIFLLVIFLIVVARQTILWNLENKRLSALLQENKTDRAIYFDKLLRLKGANLTALANDYSFWDEMVDFVKAPKPDPAWAAENLGEEMFKTFQADAVWVFRKDASRVYSLVREDILPVDAFPLSAQEIRKIFSQKLLNHFFVRTKAGLMEIRGAGIVPSSDPFRHTPAQGYFFVGRLWNEEYIRELETLVGGTVRVEASRPDPSLEKDFLKKYEVTFAQALNNWEGKPEAYVVIQIVLKSVKLFKHFSMQANVLLFVSLILVFSLIILFLTFFINAPFYSISKALKEGDVAHLEQLKKNGSEFGDISRLIVRFFGQQAELVKEVSVRKKAEERFQQVGLAAGEWIWETNVEGVCVYSSWAIEKILGYRPEEVVGKMYFYDFFDPSTREEATRLVWDIVSQRKTFNNFLSLNAHKNGSLVWIETTAFPVFNEKGEYFGYRGATLDVTQRKKAEEELRDAYLKMKEMQDQLIQAEKLNGVGQLASSVAHEVRNPLASILQGIEFLKARGFQDENVDLVIHTMRENVKRADKIVNDLLDFSRAAKLDLQPVDIVSVLDSSMDLVRSRFAFENIQVTKDIKPGLPQVLGDKNKLEQVFVNILLNAGQSMPGGGRINIRAYNTRLEKIANGVGRRAQDHFQFGEQAVVVEIEDTGTGISEENLKRIFDPFFSTKGSTGGAGLGLSVTRNILHMHRGLIAAESTLGSGTKMTVTLKIV